MTGESDVLRSFVAQAQYLEGDLRPVDRNAVGVSSTQGTKIFTSLAYRARFTTRPAGPAGCYRCLRNISASKILRRTSRYAKGSQMKRELELFLLPGSTSETITLAHLYRRAFAEARELYVVSAFLTEWNSKLRLERQCTFKIIVGKDFGITRKKACRGLLKWLGASRKDCFYVAQKIVGFHPKAMFWKDSRGGHHLLAGSSNLTKAAFNTNYEANTYAVISKANFETARAWFEEIALKSVPVTYPWIKSYKETKARGAGRRDTKSPDRDPRFGSGKSSLMSLLPHLKKSELNQLLKDRRSQLRAFAKIRSGLKNKIAECAGNKISNESFYQYLKQTWDKTSRSKGKDGSELVGQATFLRCVRD